MNFKAIGYGMICFANTLFLITNAWKLFFTYNPSGMVVIGAAMSFFHLCYFVPRYLAAQKQEAGR